MDEREAPHPAEAADAADVAGDVGEDAGIPAAAPADDAAAEAAEGARMDAFVRRMSTEADPFVIRKLDFIGGMASVDGWRPESVLPEVAFAGRSNVGKSSLLNTLVRRKAFARVSRTPGRTREVNFFTINDAMVFADLPGYGYARVSKEAKSAWRPLIEGYLQSSPALRGIVQLLDIRHDPTDDDHGMLDFLADLGAPTIVVLTKVDKLVAKQQRQRIHDIGTMLQLEQDQVIPFSSETGRGRDELGAAIVSLCAHPSWRTGS